MRTVATTSVVLLLTGCGGCKQEKKKRQWSVVTPTPSPLTLRARAPGLLMARSRSAA